MKRLGIIGGMGPAAGARLFTRVTEMTAARTDQEHIDTILLSDPSVPDRTSYLSGSTDARDFVPILQEKARLLKMLGCEVIAMSCNTAHTGYSEIASAALHTQFLHMPKETIQFVASLGYQHPIILATAWSDRKQSLPISLRRRRSRLRPPLKRAASPHNGYDLYLPKSRDDHARQNTSNSMREDHRIRRR